MVRIVIADDQPSVRRNVKVLLEDETDFEVIGEASDGVRAVELTGKLRPDILVSDLKMPHLDGIGVTRRIAKLYPEIGVIIFTMYGDTVYVEAALKAGARGYLLKQSCVDGLIEAVRSVAAGNSYIRPCVSR
jgi:DNA-binding NarL/FixJ family response regulator